MPNVQVAVFRQVAISDEMMHWVNGYFANEKPDTVRVSRIMEITTALGTKIGKRVAAEAQLLMDRMGTDFIFYRGDL